MLLVRASRAGRLVAAPGGLSRHLTVRAFQLPRALGKPTLLQSAIATISVGRYRTALAVAVGAGIQAALSSDVFCKEAPPATDRIATDWGSRGRDEAEPVVNVELSAEERAALPLISLSELSEHQGPDGPIWVTYKGLVYDVTLFADLHPGGRELLLTAGGLDLGHFFENYKVHAQTDKAATYLAPMVIGRMTEEDAVAARARTTATVHTDSRVRILGRARTKMLLVVASMPFWLFSRLLLRALHVVCAPLARLIASALPVSVPGIGVAARLPDRPGRRVAVIGGGVAGAGCAYTLSESGFEVTLYESRARLSGNARTFDWDVQGEGVKSCVSVTAWPPPLYKNYVCMLKRLEIPTAPIPLSWFVLSKVRGYEGYLWAADPEVREGSLRQTFEKDFRRYDLLQRLIGMSINVLAFDPFNRETTMYKAQCGLGVFNPLNQIPLHTMCRAFGISQEWWDIVFTPHYTASFLTDKLDKMPAVIGPAIERQIPLIPDSHNAKDAVVTTCETWAEGGKGIRTAFERMTKGSDVRTATRVVDVQLLRDGTKRVYDEFGGHADYDRVVFACPCNAIGNILKSHNWIEDVVLATPSYADDFHPGTGHMHSIMHNDASVIAPEFRQEVLRKGSNYVEVTRDADGEINIENTYNFGVQTPGINELELSQKPPMLISHAMAEGKTIEPSLIRGEGHHARAHPMPSGWNIMTMLTLRLIQGRNGVYYCSNWTTPANTHDMSLLSGIVCAHACGADYPFDDPDAKKDFHRLRTLMGV
jgi:predicted NAD/FAD-binding protein/cytochrome b involved in lipid metabolism